MRKISNDNPSAAKQFVNYSLSVTIQTDWEQTVDIKSGSRARYRQHKTY